MQCFRSVFNKILQKFRHENTFVVWLNILQNTWILLHLLIHLLYVLSIKLHEILHWRWHPEMKDRNYFAKTLVSLLSQRQYTNYRYHDGYVFHHLIWSSFFSNYILGLRIAIDQDSMKVFRVLRQRSPAIAGAHHYHAVEIKLENQSVPTFYLGVCCCGVTCGQ